MSALGKVDDYFRAVLAARQVHKLNALSAIKSVGIAKLRFGLGPRMHSMYGLAGIPVTEWKEFQHHKDLQAVLKLLNPEEKRNITKDKLLFSLHCDTHGFPSIQTVYSDPPDQSTSDAEQREAFGRCIDPVTVDLFFKLMDGAHGYGAFIATRNNSGWLYCDDSGTTSDLYEFCRKRQGIGRGWIVQPVLKTHESLREISSSRALSTARVNTCFTPEGPEILFSVLRLARGSNQTDNFNDGRNGNMVAEIDIASGKLGPARGSLSKDYPCMSSFSVDPDTGHPIAGRLVPYWEEIKALLLKSQATLPELKTLGWDVAITNQGPFIVEANSNYGGESTQVAYGRGLKPVFIDRLKQLI